MEIGSGKLFGGISVSGDTRLRDCKRGKNKDCFGNKQYFFLNLYFKVWPAGRPGGIRGS